MNSELGLAIALGLIGYAPVIPAVRDRICALSWRSRRERAGSVLRFAHGAVMASDIRRHYSSFIHGGRERNIYPVRVRAILGA